MAGRKGAKHTKLKCSTWVSPELAPFRHRYLEMKQGWRDALKAFARWSSAQGCPLTPSTIAIERAFTWDDQVLKLGNLSTRASYLLGLSGAIQLFRPDLDTWPLREAGLHQATAIRPPRMKVERCMGGRVCALPLNQWPLPQVQKWSWAKGEAGGATPVPSSAPTPGRKTRRERFGNVTVADLNRPTLPRRQNDIYRLEWCWGLWLRVTREMGVGVEPLENTIEDFVWRELERGQARGTVATNLGRIARMARIMLPAPVDCTWIWNAIDALETEAVRTQHFDVIHPGDAKVAGELEIARARAIGRTPSGARAYRDGLLVLLKVAIPARSCNVGEIEVGKQLQDRHGELWVCWEGHELKRGTIPHEYPLPAWLSVLIREYLSAWRHILTDAEKRYLWGVGRAGGTGVLSTSSINEICKRVTGRHLGGRQCRGHGFRHNLAAAVATERPKDLGLASVALQHRDHGTIDIYRRTAITLQAAAISEAIMTGLAG
jgi:integrase